MKRIAMYRAIRFMFAQLTQAMKEGNEKRPHAKLKYLTPNQREAEFSRAVE